MLKMVNIGRVGDRVTAGSQIHYKLYLVHESQVDRSKPFPKPNASREIGSIPLLEGQYWHCFPAGGPVLALLRGSLLHS